MADGKLIVGGTERSSIGAALSYRLPTSWTPSIESVSAGLDGKSAIAFVRVASTGNRFSRVLDVSMVGEWPVGVAAEPAQFYADFVLGCAVSASTAA